MTKLFHHHKQRLGGLLLSQLLLSQIASCSEKPFEFSDLRRRDGFLYLIREIYPESQTEFFHWEPRLNILFAIHKVAPNKFLIVTSNNEKNLKVRKNGAEIEPSEIFVPRAVKVYGETLSQSGELEVNKELINDFRIGYLLELETEDNFVLRSNYLELPKRRLEVVYLGEDGWDVQILRDSSKTPEKAEQDVAAEPDRAGG